ncbi:MAG: hypothetical protein ACI9UA_001722 [Pseudoalteromonas tetraodonis]|jgi:hypothetical protein
MSDQPEALPELTESVLDAGQIENLFRDIGALTQVVEIIPKHGRRDYVDDTASLDLEAAQERLLDGSFRGLQIRYRYDGSLWWDTLIGHPEGFRIVRIRHDFN